ncbi:hypothetical protein FGO68_gene16199 [Halteria grandinella]|uniref:S1/P1 nuclease n=1 Tax=Halteria grandinella TaxID=5974 RepID=A0A8J8T1T4_HALGN|nr:hypothetical protein FGO68_gene16199 [Halteria grandinella]
MTRGLQLTLLGLLASALQPRQAQCWWGNGHMIVARIAYDILEKDIRDKADSVLSHLMPFTTLEDQHPFVECATFADEIKGRGWNDQANLHYIDQPFFDQGFMIQVAPESENVTWAIDMIVANMNRKNLEMESGVSWDLSDSYHLRMLIHYIGDIHQPLHASSRYTKDYPMGDEGGNAVKLRVNASDEVTNLHALWDSVVTAQVDDMTLPLSESNWEKLGNISSRLRSEHPQSIVENNFNLDPNMWADESFQIVKEEIYSDFFDGEDSVFSPSQDYIDRSKLIAERQIAKAGYRLAQVLSNIWSSHQNKSSPLDSESHQDLTHESSKISPKFLQE